MKRGKLIGIVLFIVNMILMTIYGVIYLGTDRTAPQIGFQSADIVYRQGMGMEGLLEGVTAYDHQDGDITERVVIEKIIEAQEENTVVVFYAVSDKAGNTAKSSRVFPAVFDKDAENFMEAGVEAEWGQINEAAGQAPIVLPEGNLEQGQTPVTEPALASKPSQTPEQTQAPTPVQTQMPEQEPTPIQTRTAVQTPVAAPTRRPEPTAEPAQAVEAGTEREDAAEPEREGNLLAPTLTLKVSETKVNVGQGPAWVDIIGTLSDDEDNYETLFRNLKVSRYDRDKAGTYQVSVYTEDSDGNQSETVPLTIIVQ